jgi:hypothetical protein
VTTTKPKPKPMPTPQAVAKAVKRLTAARGYPPAIVEVGVALGIDKTRAHRAVEAAEAAGTIERRRGLPRTMRAVEAAARKST